MIPARALYTASLALALALGPAAWADEGPQPADEPVPSIAAAPVGPRTSRDKLEHLVPELGVDPYRLAPGVRPFEHRLSVSPGFGSLGSQRLFTFRVAFNPNPWLGYEAAIEHNPGQAVHAVVHSLSAVVRHPLAGRLQPYLSVGYGMMMVFPGPSVNADPVTKNALAYGGGLECYIRSDLALRGEMRGATVFGRERNQEGLVVYDYMQQTIGLSFYRSLKP